MSIVKLNAEELAVDSFSTTVPQTDPTDTANYMVQGAMACTGCPSGCGIFPDPQLA